MLTSVEELNALQRVAELEGPLSAVERGLAGLADAMCRGDAPGIDAQAAELQRALAEAVTHFARAAREGGVPPQLRQRLALASGRVAAQREALARATASLDRAIEVLLPDHPLHQVYGPSGNARAPHSGSLLA